MEFAELYRAEFRFVWRVIRYFGVPSMDLEDVAQETFIVAHRKIKDFDGRNPQGWLFAIARGVARNHLRSVQRAGNRERNASVPAARTAPDDAVAEREGLRLILDILDTLDEDKREVFVLCDVEELAAPKVAEILGIKLNTVYSRLRVARKLFNEAALGLPESETSKGSPARDGSGEGPGEVP